MKLCTIGTGLLAALALVACAMGVSGQGAETMTDEGTVALFEDFAGEWNPETGKWWVEGGERVWVEEGRLHMKADPEAVPATLRPRGVANRSAVT